MNNTNDFFTKLSTLGCCGYCPFMPGTIGALLGTIFAYLIFIFFRQQVVYILSLLLILLAILSCGIAEKRIGGKDPSCIILDEFVAMPICFLANFSKCQSIWIFFGGFVIFRIFDILKPFSLKKLERINGGLGIVLDDIGAAIYTNIILHVVIFIFGILC